MEDGGWGGRDTADDGGSARTDRAGSPDGPHLLVVGNEKGGAGKSTLAVHLAFALMKMGLTVGVLDLDVRQRSTDRYLDNRARWADRCGEPLPMPQRFTLSASSARNLDTAEAEEAEAWQGFRDSVKGLDIVVIDTPGGVTHLSNLAHGSADTVVTPINDSFVDFDLLGTINPATMKVERPSLYGEMIWDARKRRAARDKKPIDWVVVRNRMSMLDARNKRRVGEGLKELSQRIGFRIAPGVCERVIYRELFPRGLTLLDMGQFPDDTPASMSHVAARQELRDLLIVLKLPALAGEALRF